MIRYKYVFIPLFIVLLLLIIHVQSSFAATLPLRLVWERNSEADLAYYTVHYGTSSRNYTHIIDVDKQYPYCIFNENHFTAGETYYIALTATDFSLNESGYSKEITVHIEPLYTTTTISPSTTTTATTHTSTTITTPGISSTTTTITALLYIEAEEGDINPPIEIAMDEEASSGEYIWVPNGEVTVNDPSQEGGYAEYSFEVCGEGDYVVWGRVISNSISDDSFFASIDEGEYALWDTTMGGTETWVWDQVSDRGLADPVIFHLAAGVHTLTINQREAGTKIDRILITNDMAYVPEGKGEAHTTTTSPPETQKEYCSTEEALILHGTIPEEGTMGVTIPDDLTNAISATLIFTFFDPDIQGEGYIYINDNDPIDLPTGAYDNLEHSFEVTVNVDWLIQGENVFRFTHVNTWGYEVRVLCVRIGYQNITTTTIPTKPPQPTTSIKSTSTTTTSITPDETPPTGTVLINKGNETTESQVVILQLSAEDDESGMSEGALMSFSNDRTLWITKPFAPAKYWVLPPGEGLKTVYVKFCDEAGNWMTQPVSDSIMLEAQAACLNPVQLDATATESSGSFLPLYSKEKTVDGKENTGWLSPLRFSQREEYIILDLGENKIINRIDMLSHPFLVFDLFPLDFKIMLSSDSEQWSEIVTESQYALPPSRTDTWVFEETEARYIKMVITEAKPFLYFFYLTYIPEIEIHGCDETDAPGFQSPSMAPDDQTSAGAVTLTPDGVTPDDRELTLLGTSPGRPGKPVFILDTH